MAGFLCAGITSTPTMIPTDIPTSHPTIDITGKESVYRVNEN